MESSNAIRHLLEQLVNIRNGHDMPNVSRDLRSHRVECTTAGQHIFHHIHDTTGHSKKGHANIHTQVCTHPLEMCPIPPPQQGPRQYLVPILYLEEHATLPRLLCTWQKRCRPRQPQNDDTLCDRSKLPSDTTQMVQMCTWNVVLQCKTTLHFCFSELYKNFKFTILI